MICVTGDDDRRASGRRRRGSRSRKRFQVGLGAAFWTEHLARARGRDRRIESGSVFINGMVPSDPRLPFGDVKRSGYSRELSVFGIRESVNIQTVWIGPTAAPPPSAATAE